MALEHVNDLPSLIARLAAKEGPSVLGFFGAFSQVAARARPEFERFCAEHPELEAYLVDVSIVRDVHPRFGVSAVPTVVVVEHEKVTRTAIGPCSAEAYTRLLIDQPAATPTARAGTVKAAPRVTVFTTPSCSWCTRVKSYLSGHGIGYTEVDVAKDERAMQRMIARSGQMGVPQLDINGRMIVGFDKPKIDQLLGLGTGTGTGTTQSSPRGE